jgi:hypothetical protein
VSKWTSKDWNKVIELAEHLLEEWENAGITSDQQFALLDLLRTTINNRRNSYAAHIRRMKQEAGHNP